MDPRIRWVITALAVVIAIASLTMILGGRHAPPPVIITGALPGPPPADSVASDPPPASTSITPLPTVPPLTVTPIPPADAPSPPVTDAPPSQGILVHVAGAVKHSGIYTLDPGSRVVTAIKAAGGATQNADVDAVNLAEKVTDGEKVYIPRKGEAGDVAPAGNTIGHESSSASLPGPEAHTSGGSHGSRRSGPEKISDPSQGRINLNTASAEDLERLPGVGPAMAARIIAYRHENGGFKSINDLTDVAGIGDKRMARIAPFVVVR